MKRALTLLLAVGILFILAACGGGEKQPKAPEGYQLYTGEGITFAYPNGWTTTTQGVVVLLMNSLDSSTNITVASEAKSDLYSKMDEASFNTTLKPTLEQAGMAVADVRISQVKNDFTKATKIAFRATMQNINLSQTMYILPSGNLNYVVTVTQLTADDALTDAVFSTLSPR